LLWGETPENKALTNLRKALTQLRRSAGTHLSITRQNVTFNNAAPHWIDVKILETSVAQAKVLNTPTEADIKQLEDTVDLYRGDFLEGFYLRNAPVFEEWTLIERVRYRELVLQGLYILAAHHMKGEFYTKGIEFTQRLLSIEPWHEEAHQLMMRLLALSGRRGAALVQYEHSRQTLSDELGIEPGAETIALYERIRDDNLVTGFDDGPLITTAFPVAAVPSKQAISYHNLPTQKTLFIGRETERTQLADLLADPAIRLVTIAGPGGIGKTQLATAEALQMAEAGRFRDGIFFVPLTPVTTRTLLVTTIAERIDLSMAGVRQPEKTLLGFLCNKVTLIVLDNFEQLLSEIDLLLLLLKEAPQSKLLVTSRERLKLQEEWVLDLDGLPYPDNIQEAQASDYDAVNLFYQRARDCTDLPVDPGGPAGAGAGSQFDPGKSGQRDR
jgi:DNA-binding SARP family transcriptional activator